MQGPPTEPWGKLRPDPGELEWHPLVDHCADVAACAETLLLETKLHQRLARLLCQDNLTGEQVARLCVLAALHDVGKFNLGFQGRWRNPYSRGPGHVRETIALFSERGAQQRRFVEAIAYDELAAWVDGEEGLDRLLVASICHHGKPFDPEQPIALDPGLSTLWSPAGGVDPMTGISGLLRHCRSWFPIAFDSGGGRIGEQTEFQHAFAGLVTLADWLGSDANAFPYTKSRNLDRMSEARDRARRLCRFLGLTTGLARPARGSSPGFERVSDPRFFPRSAQRAVASLTVRERPTLTLLEAETGSGKTEAALWHFLRLFEAGHVDGMYFALPTRTAATQIHQRVVSAVARMFPTDLDRPPVVLAVPGYLAVDDVTGQRGLARFEVLWNDDNERWRFRGWAAENPKRYLAGAISVGTIDQVLLAALAVSHAHMRATALLRQLLVVDEVHASDSYMTAILAAVLRRHLAAGGQALLLSATLGADARDRLMRCADPNTVTTTCAAAMNTSYPQITEAVRGERLQTVGIASDGRRRAVDLDHRPIAGVPSEVAALAMNAARRGARVLVLRNTVRDALDAQRAVEAMPMPTEGEELLFRCHRLAAPYHARFAREDRIELDHALLQVLGTSRDAGGSVVVATQTAQQSLDIDADLLITDLCPADVLLQRLGRLHRHQDFPRPTGFEHPRAVVLLPESRDLGRFLGCDGEARGPHGIGRVYPDLRVLEATLRLVESTGMVSIPDDSRLWVESTTHPEALRAITSARDDAWRKHEQTIEGQSSAHRVLARNQLWRGDVPFGSETFPTDLAAAVSTRLGIGDRVVALPPETRGAFETRIREVRIPGWMLPGAPDDLALSDVDVDGTGFQCTIAGRRFCYSRFGLENVAEVREPEGGTDE